VTVPCIKRTRNGEQCGIQTQFGFSIKSNTITFQNSLKCKSGIAANGKFNSAIKIAPQYTIGNDLIYKYDTETQYWAETNFCILKTKIFELPIITSHELTHTKIYNAIYTRIMRVPISLFRLQDINGNFVVHNLNAENSSIEADYAWVYFSLSAPLLITTTKSISTGCLIQSDSNSKWITIKKGLYEKLF
jgi:hypothetical protein